jgi:hypothetical protein
MYGLAPEKLLRFVYEPFNLAISLTFYETVNSDGFVKSPSAALRCIFFVAPTCLAEASAKEDRRCDV